MGGMLPSAVLRKFPPAAGELLDALRKLMDDEMLIDAARIDYGYWADEAFEQLAAIRDTGTIQKPIDPMLVEILQLTRYCDPDRPNPPPFEAGPTGVHGHCTRAFACAVLLLVDDSDDCSLALALSSLARLDERLNVAMGSLLLVG